MADAENHILIVDDEPIIRKTLVSNFEEKNWVVYTANDGLQAIRSVRDFNPDVLFSKVERLVESYHQGASSKKSAETTH